MHKFMRLKLTTALSLGLAVIATPASAEPYAQIAAEVANAILAGDSEQQRKLLPNMTEVEFSELRKLAGCHGALTGIGGNEYVMIEWHCDAATAEPGLSRSTAMFFNHRGDLVGFSINRVFGEFADPPRGDAERDVLRAFGEALVDGKDTTLGGKIPLAEFEAARLLPYVGGDFHLSSGRTPSGQFRIFLRPADSEKGTKRAALIMFDGDGNPSGLVLGPTHATEVPLRGHGNQMLSLSTTTDVAEPERCVIC